MLGLLQTTIYYFHRMTETVEMLTTRCLTFDCYGIDEVLK
jgi:hypothetical protein